MTKSSFSGPTAPLPTQKSVLDLGRALVEELGLDPGVDTLSRWMAHYIAELIQDVETAKVEDQSAKSAKCADFILKLWERRHHLPDGNRPFEDWEPILRVIESLDLADDKPRYFHVQRVSVEETKENVETKKWLQIAEDMDHSAKILIRYCLSQAAKTAIDKSEDWVVIAEAAGLEDAVDLEVIRLLGDESELMRVSKPDDRVRKIIEDRVNRLDRFINLAEALSPTFTVQRVEIQKPQ